VPLPDLDAWLPRPAVRTHHRRSAAVAPDALWRAARDIRIGETRALGRLVRWRIPGTPGERTYNQLLRAYPFTVLDEGAEHLVTGLCGRIWTLARDYPRLAGPDDFAGWDEPGTVRVLFGHWVEQVDGGAALVSEARVQPTDRTSALRLKALWKVIGPFERLVGGEALGAATARSQRA
jgi:hypothetical protein